jgi:hypothetical protein
MWHFLFQKLVNQLVHKIGLQYLACRCLGLREVQQCIVTIESYLLDLIVDKFGYSLNIMLREDVLSPEFRWAYLDNGQTRLLSYLIVRIDEVLY